MAIHTDVEYDDITWTSSFFLESHGHHYFFEITWTSSFSFFYMIHTLHNETCNLQVSWVFCMNKKILCTPSLHQCGLIFWWTKNPIYSKKSYILQKKLASFLGLLPQQKILCTPNLHQWRLIFWWTKNHMHSKSPSMSPHSRHKLGS